MLTDRMHIWLGRDMKARVCAIAKRTRRTQSQIVRLMLEKGLMALEEADKPDDVLL